MHSTPSEASILRSLLEEQTRKNTNLTAENERLTTALRFMVDYLECEQPLVKRALQAGRTALGREDGGNE